MITFPFYTTNGDEVFCILNANKVLGVRISEKSKHSDDLAVYYSAPAVETVSRYHPATKEEFENAFFSASKAIINHFTDAGYKMT